MSKVGLSSSNLLYDLIKVVWVGLMNQFHFFTACDFPQSLFLTKHMHKL